LDLRLDTITHDGRAIVTCRDRILHGVTARRLQARVAHLLSRHRRVVLDLAGVTHMDARGLGMLAILISQAGCSNRRLVLAMPAGRVARRGSLLYYPSRRHQAASLSALIDTLWL
jgi:anti-anti-sigma factor